MKPLVKHAKWFISQRGIFILPIRFLNIVIIYSEFVGLFASCNVLITSLKSSPGLYGSDHPAP